jgi:glyoxylase-like metal-dependent hydrolase (beta-lactamase superfamily II)
MSPRSIQLGELELTPLLDAYVRLDGGAMFGVVPKPLWERRAPADDRNRISLASRPLLVQAPSTRSARSGQGRTTLIVDAGIGGKMSAKNVDIYAIDRRRNLEHGLADLGLAATDIDVALASHLHFDHVGGFTTRLESGAIVPSFPNARYKVRADEWDDATHPHERNRASYLQEDFVPLQAAGVVDFFDGDVEIIPGVRVERTGGHARSHQVIYLEAGGRTAVFTADMIPTAAHVDEPWIMGYDLYPMDTLAFKKRFVREAIEREYLIFFEHDPRIAAGYIREKDGRKYVEAVISDS